MAELNYTTHSMRRCRGTDMREISLFRRNLLTFSVEQLEAMLAQAKAAQGNDKVAQEACV